ncbi:hypothetical protein [Thalassolituus sp.]|jgi:hypothetical protein|uniref:DMP19 family protein n=1 Tax=Thalassolituus sp. TaxID=2030822 RepID=UPI002A7FCC59|nr:hypothetical protein [Thalassolituus sp.]
MLAEIRNIFSKGRVKYVNDAIVVLDEDFRSNTLWKITASNIDVVNSMMHYRVPIKNISKYALYSYYVDYYLAQASNGGFSQFVYNTRWNLNIVNCVRLGLTEMQASANLDVFERGAALFEKMDYRDVDRFFYGKYYDEDNVVREILDSINDGFYNLKNSESLLEINAHWLRNHKNLRVLNSEDIKTYIYLALNDGVNKK